MKSKILLLLALSMGVAFTSMTAMAVVDETEDNDAAPTCVVLTKSLFRGSTGDEVYKLQDFLNPRYLFVEPTGYFGKSTEAAVAAFQKANGISSVGFAGAVTRAKVKAISCDGVTDGGALSEYPVTEGDIQSLYRELLGREGDPAGMAFWVNYGRQKGLPQVRALFIASDEYKAKHPNGCTSNCGDTTSLSISSLSATNARFGDTVTITGTGFTSNTKVVFGGYWRNSTFINSTTITFVVPQSFSNGCGDFNPTGDACTQAFITLTARDYAVSVVNGSVTSNAKNLSVTSTGQATSLIDQVSYTFTPNGVITSRSKSERDTLGVLTLTNNTSASITVSTWISIQSATNGIISNLYGNLTENASEALVPYGGFLTPYLTKSVTIPAGSSKTLSLIVDSANANSGGNILVNALAVYTSSTSVYNRYISQTYRYSSEVVQTPACADNSARVGGVCYQTCPSNNQRVPEGQSCPYSVCATGTTQQSDGSCTPNPTVSDDRINSLYMTIFERKPDAAGIAFWSTKTDEDFRNGAIGSSECLTHNPCIVYKAFKELLNRWPDASGLMYWVTQLQAISNQDKYQWMRTQIINGSEYKALNPGSNPTGPTLSVVRNTSNFKIGDQTTITVSVSNAVGTPALSLDGCPPFSPRSDFVLTNGTYTSNWSVGSNAAAGTYTCTWKVTASNGTATKQDTFTIAPGATVGTVTVPQVASYTGTMCMGRPVAMFDYSAGLATASILSGEVTRTMGQNAWKIQRPTNSPKAYIFKFVAPNNASANINASTWDGRFVQFISENPCDITDAINHDRFDVEATMGGISISGSSATNPTGSQLQAGKTYYYTLLESDFTMTGFSQNMVDGSMVPGLTIDTIRSVYKRYFIDNGFYAQASAAWTGYGQMILYFGF